MSITLDPRLALLLIVATCCIGLYGYRLYLVGLVAGGAPCQPFRRGLLWRSGGWSL